MIIINERNTIQKQLVLDAVLASCNHPTAEEIYEQVEKIYPHISRGTVYRNLNRLALDGEILRIAVANAPDRFDKTRRAHIHCRCVECGSVIDLTDGKSLIAPDELIKEKCKSFKPLEYEFIISGICDGCSSIRMNKNAGGINNG